MGARGALPKNQNVVQLYGNAGKRAVRATVMATPGTPTMPRDLSPEAKAEWKRVVPELERMGVLAQVDRAVLVAYCETWSQWWAKKGHYQAPTRALLALGQKLLLNPMDRLRSPAPQAQSAHADDF